MYVGTKPDFAARLRAAQQELAELIHGRDRLNLQILQKQSEILSLTSLHSQDALTVNYENQAQAQVGLTDAIRSVLNIAGKPLTAAEVKTHLGLVGFDFRPFVNPSAAVHNTLNRLVKQGEFQYMPPGSKSFGAPNSLANQLAQKGWGPLGPRRRRP